MLFASLISLRLGCLLHPFIEGLAALLAHGSPCQPGAPLVLDVLDLRYARPTLAEDLTAPETGEGLRAEREEPFSVSLVNNH